MIIGMTPARAFLIPLRLSIVMKATNGKLEKASSEESETKTVKFDRPTDKISADRHLI